MNLVTFQAITVLSQKQKTYYPIYGLGPKIQDKLGRSLISEISLLKNLAIPMILLNVFEEVGKEEWKIYEPEIKEVYSGN